MSRTTFQGYTISAEYTGSKQAPFSTDNWNHHRVTVSKGGRRTTFDFWASIANPEIRSRSDLLGAFDCFLSDACAGQQSFDEFCSEFGYDNDSRRAEQTHKACIRSYDKAQRILAGDDLYDLSNKLRELT